MFKAKTQANRKAPKLVGLPSLTTALEQEVSTADTITIDYLALVFETLLHEIFPAKGFILLDQQGHLVQSSPRARMLCQNWPVAGASDQDAVHLGHPDRQLPATIQRLADCLIESRELFPNLKLQLQDDILLRDKTRLRIEAGWIALDSEPACIALVLENLTAAAHQQALLDAHRCRFTHREREVWELFLQRLSYQQISDELFISINTVKRHMKNIRGKQRST